MQARSLTVVALSELIETTACYCSMILSASPSRQICPKVARRLEMAFGLAPYDLDGPPQIEGPQALPSVNLLAAMPAGKAVLASRLITLLADDAISEADLEWLITTATCS